MRKLRLFLLLLFFIPIFCFGQKTKHFFIERNFGLDLDTTEFDFRLTGASNSAWDTYSYEIRYCIDNSKAIYVELYEEFQYNQLYGKCSDSFIYNHLTKNINQIRNDSTTYWVSELKEYKKNYYSLMKGGKKNSPQDTSLSLWAMKCYNNELILNTICFPDSNSYVSEADLENIFVKFINSLTYYPNSEITKVDSVLFAGLEPKIEIKDTISWEGAIWIDSEKAFEVVEVLFEIDRGHRVFHPEKGKKIEFEFYNKRIYRNGGIKPTGKGYFKLINPLGKIARLHFDFSKQFNN